MNTDRWLLVALTVTVIASVTCSMLSAYAVRNLRNELLNVNIVCEHIEEN